MASPGSRVLRALALVALATVCACSVIVSGAEEQCHTDADCAARGFPATTTCSPDSVCVAPGGSCTTNAECIAQAGNQPAICRKSDHTCAPLLSEDCPKVYGDPSDDNAIVLGSIFTLKGVNTSSGVARTNSVELAASEFQQTVVGVPGGAGDKPRPLVFVECDDSSDNTVATRAANHLVDVGVPAVIGPGGSGIVTAVAQDATIPAGMFLISPSATSTSLSAFNDLVWRTAPSDVVQAIALRDQVSALETKFKADNAVKAVKLDVVYQNNAYGTGLLDAVSKGLTINGLPLTDPGNAGFFNPYSYDATALDPSAAAGNVLTDTPSIIVLFGTSEIITKLLTPVEQNWPAQTPRPLYLIADAGRKQELLDAVNGNDALRARVRGTVPGTSNPLFSAFSLRYQGQFGSTAAVFGMAGAYDSVYLLAYAITSLGTAPVTGAAIAGAMSKMVGGAKTDVGPAGIKDALQVLQSGNAIDINGASGPLDFDLSAHEAVSDIDVWCISKDGTGSPVFASSGRFYDSSGQVMSGSFTCP